MPNIKTAIIGIGNCCSAFVQGLYYLMERSPSEENLGFPYPEVGGYKVSDISIVAAFDVDARKIGKDLSEAIFSAPNSAWRFQEVPELGVKVMKGVPLDGISEPLKGIIQMDDSPAVEVGKVLKEKGAEVVLNLIPSGAIRASRHYAQEALRAGCAFINATPTALASDEIWGRRFKKAGLPLAGDDLMDQAGSTVLHRAILEALHLRNVRIEKTFSLDVGGGTEDLNALERQRNLLKRRFKTESIKTTLPYDFQIAAGTTDYVGSLRNQRVSYLWLEGRYFAGAPIMMDIKITSLDAPNGAGVLMDVVRGVKIALDKGLGGPLEVVSAYGFKMPPSPMSIPEAIRRFEAFSKGREKEAP
jgi:myo-inositol-1-phosphate synthase